MSLKLGLRNKIRGSRVAGGFVGLLDQPFAQVAAFALALRLLREKHSGGLIRNRAEDAGTDKGEADVLPRLQPDGSKIIELNSPIENLNSKAQSRLGAPAGGGDKVFADLVDAGGANYDGFVSKGYDQSGNSNDATQSTASNQPQIVNSGSVLKNNGIPYIKFDGSDDILQFGTTIDFYTTNSEWSFFGAYQIDSYPSEFARVIANTNEITTPDVPFAIQHRDNKDVNAAASGAGIGIRVSSATGHFLSSLIKKSSNFDFDINGNTSSGSNGSLSPSTRKEMTIGGSPDGSTRLAKMKCEEMLFYESDRSSDESAIRTNMNDYYF
jgi:hypothetical protein